MLSYNLNGKDDEILPLSLTAKPGTIQPFRLIYDGKEVSVKLGGETRGLRLKATEPVVQIVYSTGEFLITDLVIEPLQ